MRRTCFALLGALVFRADKKAEVAHHVAARSGGRSVVPVELQRRRRCGWRGCVCSGMRVKTTPNSSDSATFIQVVHHPQRGFGDAGRELLVFDAVELGPRPPPRAPMHRARAGRWGEGRAAPPSRARAARGRAMIRKLPQPQAGSRKVRLRRCAWKSRRRRSRAVFERQDAGKLGPQVIEEEGADDLEDILFRRVMRAHLAPGLGVHHRLGRAKPKIAGEIGGPVEGAVRAAASRAWRCRNRGGCGSRP